MFWNAGYQSGQNERKANVEAEHYASGTAEQIDRECSAKTGEAARKCITDIVKTERESQRGESDLAAQWKSADWVMWAGILAGAQLIFTLAGLYYVRETLLATLEAVKDTGDATRAMERQNEIAEDTSKRQLRAYVTCEETYISFGNFMEPKEGEIFFRVRNSGQTPAYEVVVSSRVEFTTLDPSEYRMFFRDKATDGKPRARATIGPMFAPNQRRKFDIPPGTQRDIFGGKLKIIVGVIISYRDAFGRRHLTTGRYAFDPHTKPEQGVYGLIICTTGNNAN